MRYNDMSYGAHTFKLRYTTSFQAASSSMPAQHSGAPACHCIMASTQGEVSLLNSSCVFKFSSGDYVAISNSRWEECKENGDKPKATKSHKG
jgi:hypothetical protein